MSRNPDTSHPILRLSERSQEPSYFDANKMGRTDSKKDFRKNTGRNSNNDYRKNKGINRQNLHVINTSVYGNFQTILPPRIKENSSLIVLGTEQPIPDEHFVKHTRKIQYQKDFDLTKGNKNIKKRKQRRRRSRSYYAKGSNPYRWYNSNYNIPKLSDEDEEHFEEVSDAPFDEGEFEEVEVAQITDTTKKIPVGYRKYKPFYLKYRQKFYKPKFFIIPSQRMVINCSVAQSTSNVEVDVVSEAEYDNDHEGSAFTSDNIEQNDSGNLPILIDISQSDNGENSNDESAECSESCANNAEEKVHDEKQTSLMHSNESSVLPHKIHDTLPSPGTAPDFYQEKGIIQPAFDSWNSHLIGLEYILEIRSKISGGSVKSYHCILCEEDVHDTSADVILLHITGYKHMAKYLEKHFPSCGYKYLEINGSNNSEILLLKCCEEIHSVCGYNYMYVTHFDYYKNHKEEIKNKINNSNHFSELDFHLDVSKLKNILECSIKGEVFNLVNDLIAELSSDEDKNNMSHVDNTDRIENKIAISTPCKKAADKNTVIKNDVKDMHKNLTGQKPLGRSISTVKSNYMKLLEGADKLKNLKRKTTLKKVKVKQNILPKCHSTGVSTVKKSEFIPSISCTGMKSRFKNSSTLSSYLKQKYYRGKTKKNLTANNIRIKTSAEADTELNSSLPLSKCSSNENQGQSVLIAVKIVETEEPVKKMDETVVRSTSDQKTVSSKSKPHQKTSVHSKHCPKRILNKENVSKSSSGKKRNIDELAEQPSDKNDKSKDVAKKAEKIKPKSGKNDLAQHHSREKQSSCRKTKNSPKENISPVMQVTSKLDASSFLKKRSKSPHVKRSFSSVLSHDRQREISRSPVGRRRGSITRSLKSPLPRRARSPPSRHSKSPIARRLRSPSPLRRHSRTSARKHSRSPFRGRSTSPLRRLTRSPLRKVSRSPVRRHSRSPRRYLRRQVKKYSRSPSRRYSRSPYRSVRSPLRRKSRSPIRRSRSPLRRRSRSPIKRHSRSPVRQSKSSVRLHSRSPMRNSDASQRSRLRSPAQKFSRSHFPNDRQREYDVDIRNVSRSGNYSIKVAHKFSPSSLESRLARAITDLDPVSDEDESNYFNTMDKHQQPENTKLPISSRNLFAQILQKCSADVNSNDPSVQRLLQFMNAHSSEIQQLLGTQPNPNMSSINPVYHPQSDVHTKTAFLQQYLLSSLAGNSSVQQSTSYSAPVSSSVTSLPSQSFHHDSERTAIPSSHNQQAYSGFPKNQSRVSADQFLQHHSLPPKPQVPTEVMFNDLKATVNKLFGGNESTLKQKEKPVAPLYVTQPDPEKWDLNHPDAQRFHPSVNTVHSFNPQRSDTDFRGIPESIATQEGSISLPFSKNSGRLFNSGVSAERSIKHNLPVPPPDAKVSFCEAPRSSAHRNLFPVVNAPPGMNFSTQNRDDVVDIKISLAQRLASVLVKVGMLDVPAPLLQEMLMKIGAFSSCPPQDITETEIISILRKLRYVT